MSHGSRISLLNLCAPFTAVLICLISGIFALDDYSVRDENGKWMDLVSCKESSENQDGSLPSHSQSDEAVGRLCLRLNERVGNRLPVCCTADQQNAMLVESRQRLATSLSVYLMNTRHALVTSSAELNDYLTQLLETTKQDLHRTFTRTYSELFLSNDELFSTLISDLYAHNHNIFMDFTKTMRDFFKRLFRLLIRRNTSVPDPSESYLLCVEELFEERQPFGNVPQKMVVQIRRSFLAFSAFTEGLDVGRDVIAAVVMRNISRSCHDEVANLLYCPYCIGMAGVRPCVGYCLRAVDNCLADRNRLNKLWNNYIDEMLKIMNRLKDSFSVESVLLGLDSMITEAIEIYQSNSQSITIQLDSGCGSSDAEDVQESSPSEEELDYRAQPILPSSDEVEHDIVEADKSNSIGSSPFNNLLKEAKKNLEAFRDLWQSLPENLCHTFSAVPFIESECWNGVDKQNSHQVENGKAYEILVNGSIGRGRHIISDTDRGRLENVINRLVLARVGLTSDWWADSDDEDSESSGNGENSSGFDEDLTFLSNYDTLQHGNNAKNRASTIRTSFVACDSLLYNLGLYTIFVLFNYLVSLRFSV